MTQDREQLLREYCLNRSNESLRDRVFEAYLPLAAMTARRFSGRGVEYDDLYQVGSLALFKALERFDPERGVKFVTFAMPTVVGEIKNFFRDRARLISLPRRSGVLLAQLEQARDALTLELERVPTAQELADYSGQSLETVLETLEMQWASRPVSLDASTIDEDEEINLHSVLGVDEEGYETVERQDLVKRGLKALPDMERAVVTERFFNNHSQRETAQILGVSQMTVSRSERRAIDRLRQLMADEQRH